jgi:hypothetical protein
VFSWKGRRSQKSEVRSRKSEVGSQKSEVRSRNSEVGSQKSEVGSQNSEVRSQKWPSSAIVYIGIKTWSPCISYFFYKLLLIDFTVQINIYSVYTKEVMQKELEFQQNGQLRILCDLWNIMTTKTVSQ